MKSFGTYLPKRKVGNDYFEKILDTSDEWILKRTGIKNRHFVTDENTSDIALEASKVALKRANMKPEEIDLVLLATSTPEYYGFPSTAIILAEKLGIKVPAFDIVAACSGFVYLVSMAKAYIESNTYKNILIVGSEAYSKIMDYEDRGTCILFGDGAGAAIISSTEDKDRSILDVTIGGDGSYADMLKVSKREDGKDKLEMKGKEVFKVAVNTLSRIVLEILDKNSKKSEDIGHFIAHQANARIIKAVQDMLKLEDEKVALNIERVANTSSASILIALEELYQDGKLEDKEMLLLDAFGGGFVWGASLVHYNKF